ncbi:hypothetical protein [Bacillus inaquosorum]
MSYFIILIFVALIGALVTAAVGVISLKVEMISPKTPIESERGRTEKLLYAEIK